MVTRVVNARTHARTRDDVYVGRPSKWGNPFRVVNGDRDTAVSKYAEWIGRQPHLLAALHELKGKNLVCWCEPLNCHGRVLAKLADET